MSDNGVYAKLAERFAPEDHKTKTIGGTNLTYVDGETIISRLNEVLGWDGWSFEIKETHVLENEVWVAGRLTVYSSERTVVREQTGGQIINRKRTGEIIELSNDIKGASTDCLKKCATLVGVGLYLYDPVERREVEQDMREANRRPRPAAPSKQVENAAALTGAPVAVNTERAKLVKSLEDGIAYAHKIGLEPAIQDMAELTNEQISEMVDDLRTQCRLVLAERKKQGA